MPNLFANSICVKPLLSLKSFKLKTNLFSSNVWPLILLMVLHSNKPLISI